jgi:arylsulfatase A-like enzyme
MIHRVFFLLLLVLSPAFAAPPNIVVILADDLGYGDLGCYGATAVKTPNADRLAREGLRFTDGYATSATCTPSRYSMLTGEYAWRQQGTGVLPGDAALIVPTGRPTLASALKTAGYKTGAVGKWHLGLGEPGKKADWNGEIKPGPLEVGFDYSFIMAATGDRVPCVYVKDHRVVGLDPADPISVDYGKPFPGEPTGVDHRSELKLDWSHGHNMAVVNGVGRIGYMKGGKAALWKDEEMADTFTREAVAFIEREKDHPFYLYFATHDIHVPRVPHPRFATATTMGARGNAIAEFDWEVGEILAALDRNGLTQNTLVLLTSDNGPVLDDGYADQANELRGKHQPAGPLRAGKYSLYEGGTRVPWIVRYPARVKPGVSGALISQIDLPATFAALAGAPAPATPWIDSRNALPALLGEDRAGRDHIIEHSGRIAVRQGDWLFITPGMVTDGLGPWTRKTIEAPGALYNLVADPEQEHDLANSQGARLHDLAAVLAAETGK